MEAHLVPKVQNPEIFDVHGPQNWCQKLVWACLGTLNACRTCRECFWEVLKFSWFFVLKHFPSQNSTFLGKPMIHPCTSKKSPSSRQKSFFQYFSITYLMAFMSFLWVNEQLGTVYIPRRWVMTGFWLFSTLTVGHFRREKFMLFQSRMSSSNLKISTGFC